MSRLGRREKESTHMSATENTAMTEIRFLVANWSFIKVGSGSTKL